LSEERNIIMLVMDGFQADVFQELISEDDAAKEELRGFTFYRNYLAGYSKTAGAIPLMLTGQTYLNDEPYAVYVDREFHDHSVPVRLVESGWDVELYPLQRNMVALSPETASNVFREIDFGHAVGEIGQLAQIAAFRSVPHLGKPHILQSDFMLSGGFGGFLRASLEPPGESRQTPERAPWGLIVRTPSIGGAENGA
jgi:hypothetical protein